MTTLSDAKELLRVEEVQVYVNRMTNWQRNQWARSGYPKSRAQLERFAGLQKTR